MAYSIPADKTRLLSLLHQTECDIDAGEYERARESCALSIEMFIELGENNDFNTIAGMHKISHAYSEKKMFSEAVRTESILVEVFPRVFPNNVVDYALLLNDLVFYLYEDEQYDKAIMYINKALKLINSDNESDLVPIYIRAAELYPKTTPKRIDLSIKYQKKAVDIYANKYGKSSSSYLNELDYLAKYYEEAKDYDNACNTYLKIMHTQANDDNEEELYNYLPILDRIIYCSRKINNTELEKRCKKIAFIIKSQEFEYHEAKYASVEFPSSRDSLDYLIISENVKSYKERLNQSMKDSDEIKAEEIETEIKQYISKQPDSYGKAYFLYEETLKYSLKEKSYLTVEYGLEALRVFDSMGLITDKYVIVLCCVSAAYSELDNPAKAYDYIFRAYKLRDDYLSSDNPYYNGIIHDLALACSKLGNYRDAIKFGIKAVEADEPLLYTDRSEFYFGSLNSLATYYGNIWRYDDQLRLSQEIVKRAEEIDPEVLNDPNAPYLYNLASRYLNNGDYDQAIEVGQKVKEIRDKSGDKLLKSNIYNLLSRAYGIKGDLKNALSFAKQSNRIQKEVGRDDNMLLSDSYHLLALIYKDMGDFVEAERMERYSADLTYNNIVHNFALLSADDRKSYWDKYCSQFFIYYPNFWYQANIKDASELYNKSALFAKGILLNADTEISKLIIESGDKRALAQYQKFLKNKSILSKYVSNAHLTAKQKSIDSLRTEVEKMERELIKKYNVIGDYTKSMRMSWRDVQASLKPNDIAVEFLSFPLADNNDSILYVAVILRKKDRHPLVVPLFGEAELDTIVNNDRYDKRLYKLIWGPLEKKLSGIKNIYFSPAGKLNNINIEVLPEMVGHGIEKNYYRVSSTKLLPHSIIIDSEEPKKTVIYGGLNYETSISGLISDSKFYTSVNSSYRGDVQNIDLRSGWDFLPETLIEANTIASTLKQKEIRTEIFTDTLGTETSFKSLDGQPCNIIHIATHGFYYSESDSSKMKRAHLDYYSNQIDMLSRNYIEDFSLARSGLLMAGCNNILRGNKLPIDIEDGVLFAKEIAGMNLKNVELITISSCDSGLGDVTGDGVFGLQRAFKKAGAHSILMSLHKVDDEATRILMVEFYKNLMSGKSKHQSLKDAQKYLREVDGGKYDHPKYWAAFIMLDGLN